MPSGAHFVGIDVGTGSARAGVFSASGTLIGTAARDIRLWREDADIAEQSSDDIWQACAAAVRAAMELANITADSVHGLSFDATCSLVLLDRQFRPVTVSASGDVARNVIVWMDHRATEQARAINATGDSVLDFVGGAISPEMETPKLLWLRQHMPGSYAAAGHFFDLTDYLTWRATGSLARSVCTVTCKWTYLAHEQRWSDDYFRRIGLGDLPDEGYARIGTEIVDPGTPLASGLTHGAAAALGLNPGTPVGAGLIDAHAGGVGTMGGRDAEGAPMRRMALILGTSACSMAVTAGKRFVPGVWGPYYSAMIPGLWLAEGGQSAAGAAIDHLLRLHPAHVAAEAEARQRNRSLPDLLEAEVLAQVGDPSSAARMASGLHVLPDFLGNRSPFADPDARAMLAGLSLDSSRDSMRALYVAGLCGLAYGMGQIIAALVDKGFVLNSIVVSGGASKSLLVRQIIADATGLPVVLPETPEPVLLGTAMLGAVAAGVYADIPAAMAAMARDAVVIQPAGGAIAAFHNAKRAVFADMQALDRRSRERMAKY